MRLMRVRPQSVESLRYRLTYRCRLFPYIKPCAIRTLKTSSHGKPNTAMRAACMPHPLHALQWSPPDCPQVEVRQGQPACRLQGAAASRALAALLWYTPHTMVCRALGDITSPLGPPERVIPSCDWETVASMREDTSWHRLLSRPSWTPSKRSPRKNCVKCSTRSHSN